MRADPDRDLGSDLVGIRGSARTDRSSVLLLVSSRSVASKDQTNAAIQPIIVQPRKKFRAVISHTRRAFFPAAIMVGDIYIITKTMMTTTNMTIISDAV